MALDPTQALVGTRAAVGVSSWVAPGLAGRAFGLDVANNPQAPYLARLFGVRDVVLGVGVKQTSGEARRFWLKLGVACDVADAAAGMISARDGSLPKLSAALVTATAVAAAGLGVAALRTTTA
jgi:hypothetical protein